MRVGVRVRVRVGGEGEGEGEGGVRVRVTWAILALIAGSFGVSSGSNSHARPTIAGRADGSADPTPSTRGPAAPHRRP